MGLLADLMREESADDLALAGEESLRRDWREITSELARVIAPVADEVELTEVFRERTDTAVLKCTWLVRPKPEAALDGTFHLVFDAARGWYLVDANSKRVCLVGPGSLDREPRWEAAGVRAFLKRVLVPKEKGLVWVVASWSGGESDDEEVLVSFDGKALVGEMCRVVRAGLHPLLQPPMFGDDDWLRVTGSSIEMRGKAIQVYRFRPGRTARDGSLPGAGMLLDAADAMALCGVPIGTPVLELGSDGMLLLHSDEDDGWATVDLLVVEEMLDEAQKYRPRT